MAGKTAILEVIIQQAARGADGWATLDFLADRASLVQWWLGYQPEQLDEALRDTGNTPT